MNWSDTLQRGFGSLVDAGASVIAEKAGSSGRTNNAPQAPTPMASQPWMIYGGIGLAVVVVLFVVMRKR